MSVVQLLLEACVLFWLTYLQEIKTHSTSPKKIGVDYKNPGLSQELKNKTHIVAKSGDRRWFWIQASLWGEYMITVPLSGSCVVSIDVLCLHSLPAGFP